MIITLKDMKIKVSCNLFFFLLLQYFNNRYYFEISLYILVNLCPSVNKLINEVVLRTIL